MGPDQESELWVMAPSETRMRLAGRWKRASGRRGHRDRLGLAATRAGRGRRDKAVGAARGAGHKHRRRSMRNVYCMIQICGEHPPPQVSLPDNDVIFGRGGGGDFNSRLQSQYKQRVPARLRPQQYSPAVQLQHSEH